jgi:hypothetical protein
MHEEWTPRDRLPLPKKVFMLQLLVDIYLYAELGGRFRDLASSAPSAETLSRLPTNGCHGDQLACRYYLSEKSRGRAIPCSRDLTKGMRLYGDIPIMILGSSGKQWSSLSGKKNLRLRELLTEVAYHLSHSTTWQCLDTNCIAPPFLFLCSKTISNSDSKRQWCERGESKLLEGEWRSVHKEGRHVKQKRGAGVGQSFRFPIFVLRFRRVCLLEIPFEILHVHKNELERSLREEERKLQYIHSITSPRPYPRRVVHHVLPSNFKRSRGEVPT